MGSNRPRVNSETHLLIRHSCTRFQITSLVILFSLISLPVTSVAQNSFTDESGILDDGTPYQLVVPANWNRVLLRDLDVASEANEWTGMDKEARYRYLLNQGYAFAGTGRPRLRKFQYDPAREIANLNTTLDIFEARYGKPDRVIEYGCSGGGHVAVAVAEEFSDRIDGSIALHAHTPVWLMNTYLDGWFVLKSLIAPELAITDVPLETAPTERLAAAWQQALDAAQRTPEGRARIALAFAIGQWPAWTGTLTQQPDLDDVEALQHSMYHAVIQYAKQHPGGAARFMFESAAYGQQLSWNTGVDYREWFENGNKYHKRAVRQLYKEAGLDLDADISKVNASPRVKASQYALDFWKAPGRTVRGEPKIPLLRVHPVGDNTVPPSLTQGYGELIRANDKEDLYRDVHINLATHCDFNDAESAVIMEIMLQRLDTGKWINTEPDALNKLGEALGGGIKSRFTSFDPYKQERYNRIWMPE